ncbi:hypothetical protein ERJ75_001304100 [Trypanosoma vivax]|nr:hypothetical protein ERJ75_001304100 [Trypanosoma vivax]
MARLRRGVNEASACASAAHRQSMVERTRTKGNAAHTEDIAPRGSFGAQRRNSTRRDARAIHNCRENSKTQQVNPPHLWQRTIKRTFSVTDASTAHAPVDNAPSKWGLVGETDTHHTRLFSDLLRRHIPLN